jgi:hypothetical protein
MRNDQPVGLESGIQKQIVGSFRASPSAGGGHAWTAKAIGNYFEEPATTSSIAYTLQFITFDSGRVIYFNGIGSDGNSADLHLRYSSVNTYIHNYRRYTIYSPVSLKITKKEIYTKEAEKLIK